MSLVLTIDVEDWAQSTLDTDLPITDRSYRNMEYLLDLLAEYSRHVTCFVLGKYAEKYPDSVKRMAAEGHEIASHGFGHVDVFLQEPEVFREDIRRSKAMLEDLCGVEVQGYRAPDFSIVKQALWSLDILAEEGVKYDASINPAVAARFGIPDWPRQPAHVTLKNGLTILELPVATRRVAGRDLPVAGGGYHRLLPWLLIRQVINTALNKDDMFIAYCHPYEFDTEELKAHVPPLPLKMRLHQGLGRKSFEAKFRRIIETYDSVCAADLLDQNWPDYDYHRAGHAGAYKS